MERAWSVIEVLAVLVILICAYLIVGWPGVGLAAGSVALLASAGRER